ncbi:hypothetical protein Pint_01556 [Pistacia integerrima]|uniref:Uncharacterized protein n=1 Tax=Pistacia integerrima TaxID=434235 RepID=A0ACC0ZP67_9ROSI|nr:hypothetical protein Pint_01556 [Pistacia integerrima]
MVVFTLCGTAGSLQLLKLERDALFTIKQGLADNENHLSSWNTNNKDCYGRRGIKSNNQTDPVFVLELCPPLEPDGSVYPIGVSVERFPYQHLHPSAFPWSFNFSSNLVDLTLFDNQLNRSIPDSMYNMHSLAYVDLSENQLEGPLPESFGQLFELVVLNLEGNLFTGSLPESIGQISSLNLDVSSNSLSSVISEVQNVELIQLAGIRFIL